MTPPNVFGATNCDCGDSAPVSRGLSAACAPETAGTRNASTESSTARRVERAMFFSSHDVTDRNPANRLRHFSLQALAHAAALCLRVNVHRRQSNWNPETAKRLT